MDKLGRLLVSGFLLTLSAPSLSRAQGNPTVSVGWYNGDGHGLDPALNAILAIPAPGSN